MASPSARDISSSSARSRYCRPVSATTRYYDNAKLLDHLQETLASRRRAKIFGRQELWLSPNTITDMEATLRFSVLSSGSSGNATYVEAGGQGFLVDAGFSCRRLRRLLARIGRDLSDVSAVLLTHGHADHTSGV